MVDSIHTELIHVPNTSKVTSLLHAYIYIIEVLKHQTKNVRSSKHFLTNWRGILGRVEGGPVIVRRSGGGESEGLDSKRAPQ